MENFHRKLEQHNKLLCPFPATFRSYQFMDDVVNLYHTLSCLPILLIFSKQTPDIIPVNIMVYLQNRLVFQSTTEISLSHQKKKKKKSVPLQYDQISILYTFYIFPLSSWRKKWQPTPVFWPGESHGQGSLVSYSPWGHKESDTTERLNHHYHLTIFKIVFRMVI